MVSMVLGSSSSAMLPGTMAPMNAMEISRPVQATVVQVKAKTRQPQIFKPERVKRRRHLAAMIGENAAINQGSGFSAYRLVFGKDASTPLSNLICMPKEKAEKKQISVQDPSNPLFQHAANRQSDLRPLQSKEFFDKADEIDKAKARTIMFAQLRENRILSLARSADNYSNNAHPMFPLKNEQDRGKLVYIFSDRIPKGKSQSLTSKWLGPARIDSVVSNILAIVTTQYREQRFGKPEKTC